MRSVDRSGDAKTYPLLVHRSQTAVQATIIKNSMREHFQTNEMLEMQRWLTESESIHVVVRRNIRRVMLIPSIRRAQEAAKGT